MACRRPVRNRRRLPDPPREPGWRWSPRATKTKHAPLSADAGDFPGLKAFLEMLHDDGYDRTLPSKVPSGLPIPSDQ